MKMYQNKKYGRHGGFTMIEIGVVLAIIGLLAVIAVPAVGYMLRNGRVKSVVGSLNTIKGYVGNLQSSSASGGTIPVTEGTAPPTSGAALSAQSAVTVANAARLDIALVSVGITDKLLTFGMGNQVSTPQGTGADLVWSTKLRAFIMDDGTGNPSATLTAGRDWSNCSRLESAISNPAAIPSVALGTNFRLNGGTGNLSANTVVAYIVLKGVPYKDAIELSKTLNGEDLTTASEGSAVAQDNGPAVFTAPAAGSSTTDVYVYISSI